MGSMHSKSLFLVPYGRVVQSYQAEVRDRYLSTGHEREVATNYDYRMARLYDAELGRFLGVDALATDAPSWSPFSAMWNNPIRFIDPDGNWAGEPGGCCGGNPMSWVTKGIGTDLKGAFNLIGSEANKMYNDFKSLSENTYNSIFNYNGPRDKSLDGGVGSSFSRPEGDGNDKRVRKGESEGDIDVDRLISMPIPSDPLSKGHEFFMLGVGVHQIVEEEVFPLAEKAADAFKPGFDTTTNKYGTKFIKMNGDTIEWSPSQSNFINGQNSFL
jgi:RHS repeat-associated protein